MLKEESVNLQPLVALLLKELLVRHSFSDGGLRAAGRRAGRSAGEQPFDDYARRHAEKETISRFDPHAIDESFSSHASLSSV